MNIMKLIQIFLKNMIILFMMLKTQKKLLSRDRQMIIQNLKNQ